MGIKTIHTVWTNPPLSKVAAYCLDRIKDNNPGYEVCLHTGVDVLFGAYLHAYCAGCSFEVQKADLVRLACLEKFGGWYLDLDMVALRSMEELEEYIEAPFLTVAQHTDTRLCNNVLYGEPGWECFAAIQEEISDLVMWNTERTRTMYGPALCGKLQNQGLVKVIPKSLVNPYGTHVSAVKAFSALLEGRDYWREHGIPAPVVYHLWGQQSKTLDALGFGEGTNPWEVFDQRWRSGGKETECGVNSKKCNAVPDLEFIRMVLDDYDLNVLNDAGCGDFNWIVDLPGLDTVDYLGYDICEPPQPVLPFQKLNIATETMRPCDVILCRDTLFHFPNKEVVEALELFKKSSSFLIASSSPLANNSRRHQWHDRIQQCYSPVDLTQWLGEPLDSISVRENRILGIWSIK